MEILILNQSAQRCPRKFVFEWLLDAKKHLKAWKDQDLVVVFVDRAAMSELNWQYRRKKGPTDVLSFESAEPDSLGELVLCLEVIEENAREHGLHNRQELGYVLLHGVLHLLGYEHEASKEEARKMFRLQDRIYDALWNKWWPPKERNP